MIESQHVLEAFKVNPVLVALIIVILFLCYLLLRKDKVLQRLVEVSNSDSERYGKLITLLEILVNQKNGE
jgi:predicted PurR-regulated permease PerM